MAVKIEFDVSNNVQSPTLILATKSGEKIGVISAYDIKFTDNLNSYSKISFMAEKSKNKIKNIWDNIKDYKLVWCKEWDLWFEIYIDINESNDIIKSVVGKRLGEMELSQIMLFNIEINTENDISREDYINPTLLYNIENHSESLLHRIMEKAKHYEITHVDSTIAKLQRTFSFDEISIYDALQEISEEIGCLFVFPSHSDENGKIARTIEVYDLQSNCNTCHYRGEFTKICPKCGSSDINEGYGDDTTIFVSAENLAQNIELTTDVDSVKNCFKLEAGDDLMTATIRSCNPNGTDYIWYITDEIKQDMPKELSEKITEYDELYKYYQNDYSSNLGGTLKSQLITDKYNSLIEKYKIFNDTLNNIQLPIIGYSNLMLAYYDTIDFGIYLQSELLPSADMIETTAVKEAQKLIQANLSPVAVSDLENCSLTTANSTVLSMAKILVDSRYQVKIASSTYTYAIGDVTGKWQGSFKVQNNSNNEDNAVTETITVLINNNYEDFVKQKIQISLNKEEVEDLSIVSLFKKDYDNFCTELCKYSLDYLKIILNSAQTCIDVLIEQGVGSKETWSARTPNLYDDLYTPYRNKLEAVQSEILLRESEISIVLGQKDNDGNIISDGLQTLIIQEKNKIQEFLNFENFLGSELWNIFSSYRREDKFQNSNYISDGLNNAELFNRAFEFIETANKEIYKSAELQHSISTDLYNLLVIEEFKPIVNYFEVGNWLRIRINDEIYKLRLISYEINYGEIENISVEFSDVMRIMGGVSDIESILSQAVRMTTSYDSVQRQAIAGANSNDLLNNWVEKGLQLTATKIMNEAENQTQTWDSHGMLFRQYDSVTDDYYNTQLKIINSTLAITTDNWESVKTAIGNYLYYSPKDGKLKSAYGVNAETLVGKLILGEELGIYNNGGSMTFDENGLEITNDINTFRVNPNSNILLSLSQNDKKIFYVDELGMLHITGNGAGLDISQNQTITGISEQYSALNQNIDGITTSVRALTKELHDDYSTTADMNSAISLSVEGINTSVSNLTKELHDNYSTTVDMNSAINQSASTITLEVNKKVSYDELGSGVKSDSTGTKLQLNSEMVRISWNNITKYIQFANSKIQIYDNLSTPNLLCEFTYTGNWYYYRGITIGMIGTNGWSEDDSFRGLLFQLNRDADYMCWGHQDFDDSNLYNVKLIYYANDKKKKKGLHFCDDTYCEGKIYFADDLRTIIYADNDGIESNGSTYGGFYSEYHQILLEGTSVALRVHSNGSTNGSTRIELTDAKTVFYTTISKTIDCYNNINMNGYQILGDSDARLKTNILNSNINALDILNKIQIKEFDWISSQEHIDAGIIAQQLQEVLPNIVKEDNDTGKLSVSFIELIPYLIKGIQELNQKLNQNQSHIEQVNSSMFSSNISKSNDEWKDNYTLEEKESFIQHINPKLELKQNIYESKPLIIHKT